MNRCNFCEKGLYFVIKSFHMFASADLLKHKISCLSLVVILFTLYEIPEVAININVISKKTVLMCKILPLVYFHNMSNTFRSCLFDFTVANVSALRRLFLTIPVLHHSIDFIFISFLKNRVPLKDM